MSVFFSNTKEKDFFTAIAVYCLLSFATVTPAVVAQTAQATKRNSSIDLLIQNPDFAVIATPQRMAQSLMLKDIPVEVLDTYSERLIGCKITNMDRFVVGAGTKAVSRRNEEPIRLGAVSRFVASPSVEQLSSTFALSASTPKTRHGKTTYLSADDEVALLQMNERTFVFGTTAEVDGIVTKQRERESIVQKLLRRGEPADLKLVLLTIRNTAGWESLVEPFASALYIDSKNLREIHDVARAIECRLSVSANTVFELRFHPKEKKATDLEQVVKRVCDQACEKALPRSPSGNENGDRQRKRGQATYWQAGQRKSSMPPFCCVSPFLLLQETIKGGNDKGVIQRFIVADARTCALTGAAKSNRQSCFRTPQGNETTVLVPHQTVTDAIQE